METRLVRLKATDRRRGQVLRRFTYQGITFVAGAGWYRVSREVAEHLAGVRQVDADLISALAFDVTTEGEARVIDENEARDATAVRRATDELPLHPGRGAVTTGDLAESATAPAEERGRRGRKEKE